MGSFNLDDSQNDDDLKAYLDAKASQSEFADPQPEAAAAPAAASGGDPMDAAFKHRLLQQLLDTSSQKTAPVMPREAESGSMLNLGTIGALGLDAVFNKARGAGSIVGATAQNLDADRRAEQAHLDKLAALENHARADHQKDPLSAYLAFRNVEARDTSNTTHQETADTSKDRLIAQTNPNSELAQGKVIQVGAESGARTRGQLDIKHEFNDRTGDDRADVLAKGAQAIADTKHADAPRVSQDKANDIEITTPAAAGRAGAEAQAKIPSQEELQQHAHDVQLGLGGSSRAVFPDADVTDPEAWGSVGGNAAAFSREKALHEADVQQDQALEKMKAVRARGGVQPFNSQDKSEYQAAYAQLQGAQAKKAALGTLQEGERKILEGIDPTLDPHMSDAKDWILDRFVGGQPHDTVLEQLSGLQKQGRDAANARAKVSGYQNRWGAPPAVSDVSGPVSDTPARALPPAPDRLPVAGSARVSDTPDLPAASKSGGEAKFRITTPSGKTGVTAMDPAMAEKLKRKGFRVEAL